MDFSLADATLLLTVAGSRAYGIHHAGSDVDLKGVAVPPLRYFLGFDGRFEQADSSSTIGQFLPDLNAEERAVAGSTKLEGSVYEIRKFLALAADNNPNILDALFCRDEEIRRITPLGEELRAHRDLFLSAKAKHTFSGYAAAQLKRIKGHRSWLLSPPTHKPTRAEYGLPEHTLIPADQLAAANAAVKKQMDGWDIDWSGVPDGEVAHLQERIAATLSEIRSTLGLGADIDVRWLAAARAIGLDDNLVYVMQKEREYEANARHFVQYTEWATKRNPERAELEARHGYDTKHAAHLVRLLRMGTEILTTGRVHVWRGPGGPDDADELRAIRKGAWSYDRLIEWAEGQDLALQQLYDRRAYVVARAPDRKAIDELCVSVVSRALGNAAVAG